ncbi:metallopeptidase TldD-related protein [Alkaliphilus peptidifermentans]|uniref:PmbA protein n=1 Tax=Alkaliphilus peptidifermentans DSM 18978 TaxID=1120976 RepID=A0A1G5ATH0_9FIRM|nr:metallopeptidase TldD-related protein [Alkaliphilus peptidifermentans]SCX81129.1 PmbA protein [Alkaliphilus peptidifermentans DSM 18978]
MEEYIKELEDKIKEYMLSNKKELQIKGWYFGANKNTSIKVGMKNNELGGVYSCPKAEESIRGKIYIIWQDNRRSVAVLQSNTVKSFHKMIDLWRKASFAEAEGSDIYIEQQYPKVKLFDIEVNNMVYNNQEYLFDLLEAYHKELVGSEIKNIDASVSASTFQQYIYNSKGLAISNLSTSFSTYLYGDEIFGKSFINRRKISNEKKNQIISETAMRIHQLKNRKKLKSGEMDVLLLPEVTESFISHYLVNNLFGSHIVNKRSAFSQANFDKAEEVIRGDINLCINTTLPYNQGSYISTFEGVPGGEVLLLRNGKLQTPILDLKYAKKIKRKPTPIPAGKGSIHLYSTVMESYQDTISKIENGIIVCDLLGMHTQDATSGNYSLTAPNCIQVINGQLMGGCKAIISGNFLNALKEEYTKLGKIPMEDVPFILMKSKVTGES